MIPIGEIELLFLISDFDAVGVNLLLHEPVDDVLLHPGRGSEGQANPQRHGEPSEVDEGEGLPGKLGDVVLVVEVGPVAGEFAVAEHADGDADAPECQLPRGVAAVCVCVCVWR